MNDLFKKLLKKRNVPDGFLTPKYEDCVDPFLLPDMKLAVERILKAVKGNEKILIYGDYDVDGITASATMRDALTMAGIKEIDIMLPDRFIDGYGMSKKVVQRAKEIGTKLVITVDCGSRNNEIIDELNSAKIDVIVTDHHECGDELPKAVAVINPKRKDFIDVEGLKDLAGAGVVFELARALEKRGLIPGGQEKWLLDLVLIGTICDSMELKGENRRLTFFGMIVANKKRRVGLRELMKVAQVNKLTSESVGFRIGPRLNAAGRMESAEKALTLLLTNSKVEAARIASELNDLNEQRRTEQKRALDEISISGIGADPVIIVKGDWHEGVIGIIAGKLVEKYKRPVFVFCEKDGEYKGSGRSFGDFNLAQALCDCQKIIVSGGGHSGACGVRVLKENFDDFVDGINEYYKSLNLIGQERFLDVKEDLAVEDLGGFSIDLVDMIEKLEPFGRGNPEPIFLLEDMFVLDQRKMGATQEHLMLLLRGGDGEIMKVVGFYANDEWMDVKKGERVDVWVVTMKNEWNGTKSVEGRIVKMRLAE